MHPSFYDLSLKFLNLIFLKNSLQVFHIGSHSYARRTRFYGFIKLAPKRINDSRGCDVEAELAVRRRGHVGAPKTY